MNILKKIKNQILLVLLILAPVAVSDACGPRPVSFYGYTFLNQNIFLKKEKEKKKKNGEEVPVVAVFDGLFMGFFEKKDSVLADENLAEWEERYCGLVKKEDLRFIIYRSSIIDLQLLLTNTKSKSLVVPHRLRGNSFAEYIWENKCTENVEYLIFAKQCEPYVTAGDKWAVIRRDTAAMRRLIRIGQQQFNRAKSHYMRLRYAYQIIRLAHYAGQYEQTLRLYDKLLPKIDRQDSRFNQSIIPWWIEGHRAGALMALGRRPEASYLYAKIFRYCPGRRQSAYLSFSIRTDEEWKRCLQLCQSDEERAMLYAIRAANPKSRALEEMQAIYRLDPKSPQLELLLLQEMRKVERELLGLKFNSHRRQNKRYLGIPSQDIGIYVVDLQAFVRKCREEAKVQRPELWHLAEGYLQFLAGDFYAADKTFLAVSAKINDLKLREQLEVFRLAMEIARFDQPEPAVEEMAYRIMKENELYHRYPGFRAYLRDKMRYLYEQSGQNAKALLTYKSLTPLKVNPVPDMVEELLVVLQKPKRSNFERLLTEHFSLSDLFDLKAVLLMSQGQWEAASKVYALIPATEWAKYGRYNPFVENFHDRTNIGQKRDSLLKNIHLNRGELIKTLNDLEFEAKGNPDKAPRLYYKLGLAHYNMSYFGYEWKAMDYFRSRATWDHLNKGKRGVYSHPRFPLGNLENTDLSRALFFFEKCRLLAQSNELKAKAAFQAARCEQKLFFLTDRYQPPPCCNRIPQLPDDYLRNFNLLKEAFSDTDFYQWIIEECKYFEMFAKR